MTDISNPKQPPNATGLIVLTDGTFLWGIGFGAETAVTGEICFNTAMTGYQEILTDPSYTGQIVNFTFPHIGNSGTNEDDIENSTPACAAGLITRENITAPSNWRSTQSLTEWLSARNIPGICGIDTRALTRRIRDGGAPNGVIAHNKTGKFDLPALTALAREWPGLDGLDLAGRASCLAPYEWTEGLWSPKDGYRTQTQPRFHVVAIDYGVKRNLLRCLVHAGCRVTIVPATTPVEHILSLKPDGVFLSNGPGDPAATGLYAVPVIRTLLEKNIPLFGICLGHQLLALALGGRTEKMKLGHRGANHPVQHLATGKVEITSQNHGFHVITNSLPPAVEITHQSLFDKTNEGLRVRGKPAFSVQYHPEASPGPQDSHYLFKNFTALMEAA